MDTALQVVVALLAGSALGYWLRGLSATDIRGVTITLTKSDGVLSATTTPQVVAIKRERPIRWKIDNHTLLPRQARIRLDFFDKGTGAPIPLPDSPLEQRPAEGEAAILTTTRRVPPKAYKYNVVQTGGGLPDLVLEDPDLEILP